MENVFNKFMKFCSDSDARNGYLITIGFYNCLSDEQFIKREWKRVFGTRLDLDNPQTFSEKLQWLKLHDRRPEYSVMVDKYRARKFVADRIGEEYLVPLLGVWDKPDDIDFDSLPNQFVLKCNHNSGKGMCICYDKNQIDIKQVKQDLRNGLHENYYLKYREWPYKDVPRRIICETYLTSNPGKNELTDYKFFCFDGQPLYCQVIKDRFTKETIDFYDLDWNHQEFTGLHVNQPYPKSTVKIEKPKSLELMIECAKKLSENIPFVRADFYEVMEKVYFSEMTFFPAAGFARFAPEDWNYYLGKKIIISP